jgi:colanic acid/amylovoran biosynthesis glycosyltransferase
MEMENHPPAMSRTAIISPNLHAYSETFIHMLVRRLPGTVWLLHGAYLPTHASLRGQEPHQPIPPPPGPKPFFRLRPPAPVAPTEAQRSQALADFLRRESISAVLAEYGPSGCAAMAACAETGTRLVVHFHGYDAYRRDMLDQYGAAYRQLFQQAAAIVAVSRDMRRQLCDLGAPPHKVHVIPCGVDPLPVGEAPARLSGLLLWVGRFVEKKQPELALRAFAQAHADAPGLRLAMIGDGDLRPACESLVAALGLGAAVSFLGAQPAHSVAETMQHAEALLLSSGRAADGDSEGLPIVLLEAMAAGLPVVATRHAGILDAVQDGIEGLLYDSGDAAGLAAGLLRLHRDPALRQRLARAAQARHSAEFMASRYVAAIQALLHPGATV